MTNSKSQLKLGDVLYQKFLVQKDVNTAKIKQVITPANFRVGINECDAALTVTGPIFSLCSDTTSVIQGNLIVCGTLTANVSASVIDEKVKVSSNDTTSGYLFSKLVAGTNITLTEQNDGSNETVLISAAGGASSLTWSDTLQLGRESRGYIPVLSDGSYMIGESGTIAHALDLRGGNTLSLSGQAGPLVLRGGTYSGTPGAGSFVGGPIMGFGGDGNIDNVTASSPGGDVYFRAGLGMGASVSASQLGTGDGDYGQARVILSNNVYAEGDNIDTPVVTFVDRRGVDLGFGYVPTVISSSLHVRAARPEHIDIFTTSPFDSHNHITGNVGSLFVDIGETDNDSYSYDRYPSLWIKRTNFVSPGSPLTSSTDGDGYARNNQEWWQFSQQRVTGALAGPFDGPFKLGSLRTCFPGSAGAIAMIDVNLLGVSFSSAGPGQVQPEETYSRRFRFTAWHREFLSSSNQADVMFHEITVPLATGEATGWSSSIQTSGSDIVLFVTGSTTNSTLWRAVWTANGDHAFAAPVSAGGGPGGPG